MINPISLFFGFSGRIGRRAYWLGLIVLVAISPFSIWTVLSQDPFTDAIAQIRTLGWAGVGWTLALFVPLAALNTKRLHDLGQSGLHAVLFYAPAAIATTRLFAADVAPFAGTDWAAFEYWAGWALWLAGAAGLWFLVRLGFYRGADGPNAYGAGRGAVAASPRAA